MEGPPRNCAPEFVGYASQGWRLVAGPADRKAQVAEGYNGRASVPFTATVRTRQDLLQGSR